MPAANEVDFLLSRPQYDVISKAAERNLFMAGQGSGKTAVMSFLSFLFITYCPTSPGFVGANTHKQLSDATMKEVLKGWSSMGLNEWSPANTSGRYVIGIKPPAHFTPHGYTFVDNRSKLFFDNGAVIFLGSLENYDALEGQEWGWALIDETADTREDAIRTVLTARLRSRGLYLKHDGLFPFNTTGGKPINPLFVFTKPGRVDWINKYFDLETHRDEITRRALSKETYYQKSTDNRNIVVASTYHNDRNLPPGWIENRVKDLSDDEVKRLIYGSPFSKSGAEYYGSFSVDRHVGRCELLPNSPFHLTFDFNVYPYMTLQVWQIADNGLKNKALLIQEFAMKSPKNTIEHTCKAFSDEYGHLATRTGVYFYGDSSGKSSQPLKSVKNFFGVIENELRPYLRTDSRRILKQNARHNSVGNKTIGRREFMNGVFRGRYDVDILIDPSCKHSIEDFETVKEDPNGAKLKKKEMVDGVMCEKVGHMSDAADAFICYIWGKYLKDK